MDTRRFLIATLLSVAVLVLWQQLFPPPEPPVREPAERSAPLASPGPPEAAPSAAGPPPEPAAPPDAAAPPVEAPAAPEPIEAAAERREVLENEALEAVFTNRGARLVSVRLKGHAAAAGGAVNLVRERGTYPLPLAITERRGDPGRLGQALYAVERETTAEGESLLFRYAGPTGAATKRFTLRPNGLLKLEVEVPGRTDWALLLGPGIRNPSVDEVGSRFLMRGVVYRLGDGTERLDAARTDEESLVPAGGLSWVGIQDTYFLNAVMPLEGVEQVLVRPLLYLPEAGGRFIAQPTEAEQDGEGASRELALVVQPSGSRLVADSYWGAKEYERLKGYERPAGGAYGLEGTVELGWFRFLALPLLYGLRWIHDNVVANYGWAIILMTVAIRILLFPLMHKSTVSMQKMQELNPKIQAIRQKYRGKLKDKQGRPNTEAQRKMNEEVMAVYKAEGVNPAGGCLPLLLQIPVLFAFYRLLSAAIELRNAPWLFWVQDLSAPDPYYVLPIVMGASQFLQQKLTPSAADPMQRRIFQLMPIFFTILFLGFPSGLVLYWLTNNVLGIAQQVIYKKLKPSEKPSEKAATGKGKPKPGGKR